MSLGEYRRKRRFEETPEPRGAVGAAGDRPRFVVQEHHARRVHWDLRLEMEGVLRSWAVPKGPSLDPAEKRLAVLVEDHPLEYAEFEGIIPEGHYGAGTVMVWDSGTYACREGPPAEAFRRGKMTLVFFGEKLRGEFHFVRTKRNEGRDWLLFKGKDEFAASGASPLGTRSAASGRSIEEIRADRGTRWTSPAPGAQSRESGSLPADAGGRAPRRGSAGGSPPSGDETPRPSRVPGRRGARASPDPFPAPFRPMLAGPADRPFDRPGWLFEVKWDGVRALAFVRRRGAAQDVGLYTRGLRRLNAQFPEVVEALAGLREDSVVLDGEIIAPDEHGQPSFARLQQRLHRDADAGGHPDRERVPVVYVAFDCLYLGGRDLRARPLSERRQRLEALSLSPGVIRGEVVEAHGRALFDAVRQRGLEGIVAKRADSPYRPGVRSPDWQKVKVRQTAEAVVGGFTRGKGHRTRTFGALILGQHDPDGRLVHIGQTGGGFSDGDLRVLSRRLEPLVTEACPFAARPRTPTPPTWVRPEVVVEVEYAERTPDGMLRFPRFLRVRDDVPAQEARLTADAAGPEAGASAAQAVHAAAPGGGAPADGRSTGVRPDAPPGSPAPAAAPPAAAPPPRDAGRDPEGRGAALPRGLALTNLDKVFFPEAGYTKGDVVEYYRRVAPYIVPHLVDRPLTLRRFPDGIAGQDFFQKDVQAPPFVRTARIWSDQGGRDVQGIIGADEATLLWLAQLGCIEAHAWFSRITPVPGRGRGRPGTSFAGSERAIEGSVLNYPDFVVFDIDPFLYPEGQGPTRRHGELDPDYTRRGFEAARQAALWLAEALQPLGLRAYPKTSGKTGLHVFLPIARRYTYAETHAFAKTIAGWLAGRHPEELTVAWAVRERVGKVFLDYNQNARGKTLAGVYSLRPVPQATVSVPVTWEELRVGVDPLAWTIETVFDRLRRAGDLWAGILDAAQDLDGIFKTMGSGRPAG